MLIKKMTARECGEILTRNSMGRLGCSRDNQPYVVPIYFAYEPDHLFGFSTPGKKIEWMRANPKVCMEVDELKNHFEWASVIIDGRYEELPDSEQFRSERLQAQTALERRMLWWQTAYAAKQPRKVREFTPPLLFRIHIDSMTGHRAVPDAVESRYCESPPDSTRMRG